MISMISPIYEKIGRKGKIHTSGLVPVYPLTEGVTQKQVRFLIRQSLEFLNELEEILPTHIKERQKLLDLDQAISNIHFPQSKEYLHRARARLAFDELFILQLKSGIIKKERESSQAQAIAFKEKDTREFVDSLPFQLTEDQKKSAWRILKDMEEAKPMARLLNGDVGSGKTVVAAIAMLNTALNGLQSALMAPTEILARQHYGSIKKLLGSFPIRIALLSSSTRALNTDDKIGKAKLFEMIANGEVDIVIGTHALVSEKLKFEKLGLAVIDEQHRFGVAQRKALIEKSGNPGTVPHLLSMTATPIPRSLALTLFGDLDISVISQMPSGRKPIITKLVFDSGRQKVYDFVREQIASGRQAFVICPLIEESDTLGVKSAESEYKLLNENIFKDIPMAMLHGKMKPKEKEEIMKGFLENKHKILVSTSVVEVGVDVPNATIMMIEGSERFGLAQLHQFRGRVGRGDLQSYCVMFTGSNSPDTLKRLKIMENTRDGFKLAQMDLELRGSGEIYGTRQKGFPEMKIATLWDLELMRNAKVEADKLINTDPEFKSALILKEEVDRSLKEIHLE
ncbi:ATP-dependent DNA helicase RecG [Candidatus Falkowbacteria bacterium]|nr:ATP-dependent DNA helicase RecG [Candidatus Falkowbacteria bacterium]